MVLVEPVSTKKELLDFITYPHQLYKESSCYVPHLIFERKQFFHPDKNPFFAHGEVLYFLARGKGGNILGRATAHIDRKYLKYHGNQTGFFGFFDSVDDGCVAAALMEAVEEFHRDRGMERVIGPMNFNTNDEVGVLTRGFDSPPFIMMPYNYPYYGALLEGRGFAKEKDLYAYYTEYSGFIPRGIERVSARMKRKTPVRIRKFDLKHFERELGVVKKIYNSAWADNWGFIPMDGREIEYLAKNLKPVIDPSIAFFACLDDEEVGFFIAIPDFNIILKKMGGRLFPFGFLHFFISKKKINRMRVLVMGVVEQYRHAGVEAVMLEEIYRTAPSAGYPRGELSWILEDNHVMNRIISRIVSEPYKTYRVYGKEL